MKKNVKKHQPKCKSILDFKSIIHTINKNSYIYFGEKGLEKYEKNLIESLIKMRFAGQKPPIELKERIRLCRKPY